MRQIQDREKYFLNKLIDVQNDGFQVSPTTNSCTQGIWLYSNPIINEQNNLQVYFQTQKVVNKE
ncbi:unnamed protein product [Paramecium octaurelia]|uniref:Guanylate-binding protein N-terminal domain-containing protein n=1 Tax=Paramecium octaurelia TaxID=43137 RepID=A0A8S1WSX1_PAROT|nr:unnamed protein product [Paramecium octaurelia]